MIDKKDNPEFLNSFLQYSSVILNKSQNSVKEYNYDLSNFFKFMSNHLGFSSEEDIKNTDIHELDIDFLKQITLEDIHSYLYYLKGEYDSKPATLARKVSSIRIFFQYLCNKSKKIPNNPAQDLETPKLDKRLPKYLTLEDSQKLLDVAEQPKQTTHGNHDNSERNFAIITLFLNCGMRLSELVNINIKDIDFYDNKLNVIGKGNKERTIYLNNACIGAIKRYLDVRPHEGVKGTSRDALFLSEQKRRISNRTVQYIIKEELKNAGLDSRKYSVHKLRHTAATLMYQYGQVDIRALQVLLGHESISTTEIYTHVSNEQVRNAVENNPLANRT